MNLSWRWLVIAAAALAGLAGGIYAGLTHSPPNSTQLSVDAIYATSLYDLDRQQRPLAAWKDRTLLINFWATWCVPCREEVPALTRIQRRFSAKNLQIVGIALDTPDLALSFAKTYGINYPVLIGGLETIDLTRSLGNRGGALPFTLVLAPGGRAFRTHLGALTEPEIEALIAETEAAAKPSAP